MDVPHTLVVCIAEHEYVAQLRSRNLVEELAQRVVDEVLGIGWCVTPSKWHYKAFGLALKRIECCKPIVSLLPADTDECKDDAFSGEVPGFTTALQRVWCHRIG